MRGKKRPAVVVQADAYAAAVKTVVVAEVTSNLSMAQDPACLLVEVNTPEGQATGLKKDSVVSALVLVTDLRRRGGSDPRPTLPVLLTKLDGCLRVALGLP